MDMYTEHNTNNKLYAIWNSMKQRCNNSNNKKYPRYGGRGIKVCKEWLYSFDSFKEWSVKNGYREGLAIDRINNDGNYEPSNCRWTDYKMQNNNTSAIELITYNGETHTKAQWAELYGLSLKSVYQKMERSNLSFIEALFSVGEKRERLITYNGKTQNIRQWAEELNISYTCLVNRLDCLHLTVKEAFEKPYKSRKNRIN